jgi:hypothetical protein
MIPVKHIDPDDLPLYAMQLLPPEEMEEMRLHLQHSAEARRVLAEIYADLSIFAHGADMQDAPAHSRQRLMKQVAQEKKEIPESPLDRYTSGIDTFAPRLASSSLIDDEPVHKSFVAKTAPWAGWLLAAGLAAFAVMLHQQNDSLQTTVSSVKAQNAKTQLAAEVANQLLQTMKDPDAVHATLTSAEAKPLPSGRVTYLATKGSLVFLASNMDPLQPSKVYELWVIPADGRAPMPAGTFRPDSKGNANVVLPVLAAGVEAKAFGVTIEDGEGSTVPTAPIIMHGFPT